MADNSYKLEFTLSDGSKINAGTITAPQGEQGPQGETGPQGVSITGATLTPIT